MTGILRVPWRAVTFLASKIRGFLAGPRQEAPAPRPAASGVLHGARLLALAAIAVLVAAASMVSVAESYRALYERAAGHGLSGRWAVIWPMQVDSFIAVGELALFDRWAPRSRLAAWLVTLAGLAVSAAGNVGHVHGHLLADRATAAVPPLAAAAALAVGLGVLKRVVEHHHRATAPDSQPDQVPVPEAAPAPGTPVPVPPAGLNGHGHAAAELFAADLAAGKVPGVRRVRREMHLGQPRAQKVREYLTGLVLGSDHEGDE
jgi:hypothetical protein